MIKNPKNLNYVPEYYHFYIRLIPEDNVIAALQNNANSMMDFLNAIPGDKADYAYAPNKWTVKEVISHIIDTERIFAYRALRFSRNDKNPLIAFNENAYVSQSNASNRDLTDIVAEFNNLRKSTLDLYKSFSGEMLRNYGQCNSSFVGVDALAFMISGHAAHHQNVLHERYL